MANYPSGLYTEEEVQARLSYRFNEFAKRTGCLGSTSNHLTSTSGQRDYSLDNNAVDILHVAYTNGSGVRVSIPPGDTQQVDYLYGDGETSVAVPFIHTIELGDENTISLIPPPNASSRAIHLIYTRRPDNLATTPSGAAFDFPDDLTPFVKYGALADLFTKEGEVYDPERAEVCQQIYELGIQIVKGWISPNIENE